MNPAEAAKIAQESLRLMKEAHLSPSDALAKAYTQSATATSGLTAYDLEAPAKLLFPVLTPLRNIIPRVSGKGGIQANWRAVTAINSTSVSPVVSQGNRGGVTTDTVADYTAAYKGLGLEQSVTFEADYAGEGFQDVKALAVQNLLKSMMIAEEKKILGGNTSFPLANTATPTLSQANSGGTLLGNTSYGVGCVAMTLDGYLLSSLTTGVVQSYTRTNADSSTDTINGGLSKPATQANVTTANDGANAHTISASVTAVSGAVAYAWFWGLASGNLTLGAITTINSVLITDAAAGTGVSPGTANYAALTATNNSTNSLDFDGLLTFASNSSLNSYQAHLATGTAGTGSTLTSDGAGGVVEIDAALKSFWDNYRLSPDTIWVNSQEQKTITKIVMAANSSTTAMRFAFNVEQGMIAGGTMVKSYLNKYSMNGAVEIPIKLHPNVPPGTILFTTAQLPYPMSNVSNVMQIRARREYYQIEWPLRTRKYEFGVYADEVLQHYFPPSLGVISNIAAS